MGEPTVDGLSVRTVPDVVGRARGRLGGGRESGGSMVEDGFQF